jgi:pyruvate kinase
VLSGEAATGDFPAPTVKMMAQIIREAEAAIDIIAAAANM